MAHNEESNSASTNVERNTDGVVDMMLGKNDEKVIDSETMIQETQKRIWKSLKHGIEYDATVDRSDVFLRQHVNEKLHMVVPVSYTHLTLPTKRIV